MNLLRISLLFVFALGVVPAAWAQDAKPFTLEEAVTYALEQNNQVKASRFDVYIAQKQVKEILASGYPQISGSAQAQYNFNIPQFVLVAEGQDPIAITAGFPWNTTLGLSVNQLVFDGTFFIGLQASRTFVDLAQISENRTKEQLAYDVSKAYLTALVSRERMAVLDANVSRLEELFSETSALQASGFVEKIDVERLMINLTNLRVEREKVARFVETAHDLLKFQMNYPVNEEIRLTESVTDLKAPGLESIDAASFAIENRLEYQLLRTQIDLENYNTRRFKAGYLPALYAFGSYQFQNQWDGSTEANKFPGINFPVTLAGLQLNVPIFDGFRKQQQIQTSQLNIKKLELQMSTFENAAQLELRTARRNVENAYASMQTLEENVALAEKVFRISQTKYKEGVGSSLEVNDAETQLKESQANLLNATLEYLLARLDLQKALGQFSPDAAE